jgi:multicomponent K+:H+ antiporter subunit E
MQDSKETQKFLDRWLLHPFLTLMLIVLWMLLSNSFSAGALVVGVVLALAIQKITSHYWPERPTIKHPLKVVAFIFVVIWDVIVANIQVALLILFRPLEKLNTRWVCVPLELTSDEAKTVFAGVITMTPGTVSSDFSADGKSLLVHCLDAKDADATVHFMKTRYETRLQEIFQ